MVAHPASVEKADASLRNRLTTKEHCSVSSFVLQAVQSAVGHQVRIIRDSSNYALFTVKADQGNQGSTNTSVPIREDETVDGVHGLQRLGTNQGFEGTLDSEVTRSFMSDTAAEAGNEFVERLDDNGTHKGLIAIAPHGGEIEPRTDDQAKHVQSQLASMGVSSWRCKGFGDRDAFERWHITSTDINEASFPELRKVISRGFKHAVAFHGYTPDLDNPDPNRRQPHILVGGGAPESLRQDIVTAIKNAVPPSITVRGSTTADAFNGDSPLNIVNRLTANLAGGVQIEQSEEARGLTANLDRWQAIADAVADVYRDLLSLQAAVGGGISITCTLPPSCNIDAGTLVVRFHNAHIGGLGQVTDQRLEFTNRGAGDATVTFPPPPAPDTSPFRWDNIGTFVLAPGSSRRVFLEFHPRGLGTFRQPLTVTSDTPDSPHRLRLEGRGVPGLEP